MCLVRFFGDCRSLNLRAAEHTLCSLASLGGLSGGPVGSWRFVWTPLVRFSGVVWGCSGRVLGGASCRSESTRRVQGAGLGRIWGLRHGTSAGRPAFVSKQTDKQPKDTYLMPIHEQPSETIWTHPTRRSCLQRGCGYGIQALPELASLDMVIHSSPISVAPLLHVRLGVSIWIRCQMN